MTVKIDKQDDFQAKEDSMVFHSHTMALVYVEVLRRLHCILVVLKPHSALLPCIILSQSCSIL